MYCEFCEASTHTKLIEKLQVQASHDYDYSVKASLPFSTTEMQSEKGKYCSAY